MSSIYISVKCDFFGSRIIMDQQAMKDYFCKPCNQTFQYKVPKSFRHHQLFHHSILRGFKCPYCKLEYVSRYPKSLLLHMASIHQVRY